MRFIRSALISLVVLVTLLGVISATSYAQATKNPAEIHIGYQAGGVWSLLKVQQTLEKAFPDTKISWALFPSGPPLLEALNSGAIDIGATGETPPIFAQA